MPDTILSTAPIGIRIDRAPRMARLLLRGDPAVLGRAFALDLPTRPCTSVPGERSALWLGPDEWLVLAPEATVWPESDADSGVAIDIGHRQVGFLIQGTLAEAALAVACPLDLSLSAFPTGTCTRTVFGKAEIVLWRREEYLFHLEVWRSFAPYVHDLLAIGQADAATSCPPSASRPR